MVRIDVSTHAHDFIYVSRTCSPSGRQEGKVHIRGGGWGPSWETSSLFWLAFDGCVGCVFETHNQASSTQATARAEMPDTRSCIDY